MLHRWDGKPMQWSKGNPSEKGPRRAETSVSVGTPVVAGDACPLELVARANASSTPPGGKKGVKFSVALQMLAGVKDNAEARAIAQMKTAGDMFKGVLPPPVQAVTNFDIERRGEQLILTVELDEVKEFLDGFWTDLRKDDNCVNATFSVRSPTLDVSKLVAATEHAPRDMLQLCQFTASLEADVSDDMWFHTYRASRLPQAASAAAARGGRQTEIPAEADLLELITQSKFEELCVAVVVAFFRRAGAHVLVPSMKELLDEVYKTGGMKVELPEFVEYMSADVFRSLIAMVLQGSPIRQNEKLYRCITGVVAGFVSAECTVNAGGGTVHLTLDATGLERIAELLPSFKQVMQVS